MNGIILAGGKGTRMQPLTNTMPKPLLSIKGRPILEWSLLNLGGLVDQVLVVVNTMQDQIEAYMRQQRIIPHYRLVEQRPEPLGTGHALQCCQPYLTQREFLVLNGDDLYDHASLEKLAAQPLGILGAMRDDPARFGVLTADDNGKLIRIEEKPKFYPASALVNAGAYKLDSRVFDYELKLSARGEYEITDYVQYLADSGVVQVVPGQFWFPVGRPADLALAQTLNLDTLIPG
jgi:dTDP-glucose pyrophosphorylase